jgi:hypothetical protein
MCFVLVVLALCRGVRLRYLRQSVASISCSDSRKGRVGAARVGAASKLARSERFELPTLGIEIRDDVNDFNYLDVRCCSGVAADHLCANSIRFLPAQI